MSQSLMLMLILVVHVCKTILGHNTLVTWQFVYYYFNALVFDLT